MKKAILFWIVVFAITIIVNSCGARKSDSSKTSESVKTDFSGFFRNSGNSEEILKQDMNLKKWSFTNYNSQTDSESEEFTVEPEDPTKPASYTDPSGKKHILENAKMTNKKNNEQTKTNSGISENSEEILKADLQKKAEQKAEGEAKIKADAKKADANKQTTRDAYSIWNILWLIIPIGISILLWKKIKLKKLIA